MSQIMGPQSDNYTRITLVQNDWIIQENIHTSNGRDGRFSFLPLLDPLILLLLSAVEFCPFQTAPFLSVELVFISSGMTHW
jgi:hypothetical protein